MSKIRRLAIQRWTCHSTAAALVIATLAALRSDAELGELLATVLTGLTVAVTMTQAFAMSLAFERAAFSPITGLIVYVTLTALLAVVIAVAEGHASAATAAGVGLIVWTIAISRYARRSIEPVEHGQLHYVPSRWQVWRNQRWGTEMLTACGRVIEHGPDDPDHPEASPELPTCPACVSALGYDPSLHHSKKENRT